MIPVLQEFTICRGDKASVQIAIMVIQGLLITSEEHRLQWRPKVEGEGDLLAHGLTHTGLNPILWLLVLCMLHHLGFLFFFFIEKNFFLALSLTYLY